MIPRMVLAVFMLNYIFVSGSGEGLIGTPGPEPRLQAPVTGPTDAKASRTPEIEIRLLTPIVFEGQSIELECHVPRDLRNRVLEYGIPDVSQSQRPLDGDVESQVIFPATIGPVPCGSEIAYCAVYRVPPREDPPGRWHGVTASLVVAGCQ